jgi:hypothetical protein
MHHIESRVRYEPDGSIRADDMGFDNELNEVLNLNLSILMNNRKGVYDAVLEWWRNEKTRNFGPVPRERIEREQARHHLGSGMLAPYGQVAVWLLGQKLAGMAA